MHVVVAGAHGQIAMLLHPLLNERGHIVRGLIRNPEQAPALRAASVEPVICDLEGTDSVDEAIAGGDAIVFAAGAGPGSGATRKNTMDRDGATKLIDAAKRLGIRRFVMISAINAETPSGNDVFRIYLKAKSDADKALRASGLDYTIVRPGRLTDAPASGTVQIAASLSSGEIARADVAAVVSEVLASDSTIGCQFDLLSGAVPIAEAVRSAADIKNG